MSRPVYLALHALGAGGKTNAVLDQSRMFKNAGYAPAIVTFDFQPSFTKRVAALRANGTLLDDTPVINVYDELRRRNTLDDSQLWSIAEDSSETDLVQQDDEFGKKFYKRYFQSDGSYVKFCRWDRLGNMIQTTYFNARNSSIRREYGETGYCVKEVRYDPRTGAPNQENFYTPDGFCYLQIWLNPNTGTQQALYEFEKSTMRSRRYKNSREWHISWLERILSEATVKPLVVAETSSTVSKTLDLPDAIADRVYMFHENQFAAPFKKGAPIRADYRSSLNRFAEMRSLVVLTPSQATDIKSIYGEHNNITIVPNVMPDRRSGAPVAKVPGRIGLFGRLAPQKHIDLALLVFQAVVKTLPDASLEIFGDGPDRRTLEELTRKLGIEKSVHFNGRVTGVGDEYARCIVTMSTSLWEALPLAVGESLAAGTPVVSFDINYGPRDLIEDGVNGYLIPDGNLRIMRRRLVELLRNPALAEKLGRHGEAVMREKFNESMALEAWKRAFAKAASSGS